jgi:hypothetical protein
MSPTMGINIYSDTLIRALILFKKIIKTNGSHKTTTSFFLMALLVLAAATISIAPYSIEATIIPEIPDLCSTYQILCEEEPPGEETPPPTGGGGGGEADFRAIFLPYIDGDAQRSLYNQELDSSDLVVMHLGLNQAPPTSDLNDLDSITSVPDTRKGLEFFSLPEIKKYAPLVAQRGWGFISYDIEGISPDSEEANPVAAVKTAKQYADSAGIQLMVAPSNSIVSSHAAKIAPYVDRFHMQSQARQDDDSTCTSMRDWINGRITSIESAKSSLSGEITAQVTLTRNNAPGKTIYQTVEDCMDRPLTEGGGRADGLSIWLGNPQFKDGTYKRLLEHFESGYS